MLIYVAGPFTADTTAGVEGNVDRAIAAGMALFDLGHVPMIPHLGIEVDRWCDCSGHRRLSWDEWMSWHAEALGRCDALFYLAPSRGADAELAAAERRGVPIYRTIDEVPKG